VPVLTDFWYIKFLRIAYPQERLPLGVPKDEFRWMIFEKSTLMGV